MTDRAAYCFADGIVQRTVDGEMVLLDTARQQYFGLDVVGADIVTRLVTVPLDDAMAGLAADYHVDPAVLAADVEALVSELLAAGLLLRADR